MFWAKLYVVFILMTLQLDSTLQKLAKKRLVSQPKENCNCNSAGWQKLNQYPRCVGARHDTYGTFRYRGEPKFLAAIKFVHHSGQIRCQSAVVHDSNWGCNHGVESTLAIFLTDWKNHVIFPSKRQVRFTEKGRWYGLPGYDAGSPELVLSNFATPFYLNRNQRLRIWYGEDLFDHDEHNNHGRVCMDVYGYLL